MIHVRDPSLVALIVPRLLLSQHGVHPDLHSFPTRRSSDLKRRLILYQQVVALHQQGGTISGIARQLQKSFLLDRKSTRLNSSHLGISYAVFCLKKKIFKPSRPITRRGQPYAAATRPTSA